MNRQIQDNPLGIFTVFYPTTPKNTPAAFGPIGVK